MAMMRVAATNRILAASDSLEVLSLLATRICHDFAGALGTLAGTLELAAEEGGEAALLSQEIAGVLVARVRLLRAAWGGGAGTLDAGALGGMALGLAGVERLRLDFSGLDGELEEVPARLALCLLLVAGTVLPRGGGIAVAHAAGGGVAVTLDGGIWPQGLAVPDWAAGPRGMPVPMAALTALAHGWSIRVDGAVAVAAVG
jgi:histidine phosphotransferase ChpT